MAQAKCRIKRKSTYFNVDDPEQHELLDYADSLDNFSDWVREKLAEDKLLKEHGPLEDSKLDPKELAALVESLLETKLAGRIIATDQEEKSNGVNVDMDQFF